ncbi:MAG TPA: N-acetyltransferase [Nitrospiria bacterium]|nr:N-acetyltransferase [Nitrospiria bacterium]
MIAIRKERPPDLSAREELLGEAFGRRRHRKSSQRLRDGQLPANNLAFVATEGKRVIGTARLWDIVCGTGQRALLLGPVAVAGDCRNRGVGTALVRQALAAARRHGHRAIVLVGDAAFYGRFGFSAEKTAALRMPGPFERHRLLALELVPNALKGARGLLRTANGPLSEADLAASAA